MIKPMLAEIGEHRHHFYVPEGGPLSIHGLLYLLLILGVLYGVGYALVWFVTEVCKITNKLARILIIGVCLFIGILMVLDYFGVS